MDGYDDVLQFMSKVGDQDLNYRSFPTGTQCSGQSKWHLLNEVANYKQPLVQPQPEPVIAFNARTNSSAESSSFLSNTVAQTQSKNSANAGFSHLFKEQQRQDKQTKPAPNDSLSALFSRIGS